MNLLPLILIPICSLLNNWGGQAVWIPANRIVCRVFGIGIAFGAVSALYLPLYTVYIITAVAMAGMALWAVPANGEEFMALKDEPDTHGTNGYKWIYKICCKILGVTLEQKLTPEQTRNWGTAYGCILGLFQLPMFVVLSYYLTPWAIVLGLLGAVQGFIYRWSNGVPQAEWVNGAWIGLRLALVLMV